ncbi:hypothetical protein KCU71_g94, partial [Aureobasidium melanogenum]
MAPNWTPEQQLANDAEVEAIVFETIESVVKWAQERREQETLEAVTKNIMEMVIDIPNDVSHCGVILIEQMYQHLRILLTAGSVERQLSSSDNTEANHAARTLLLRETGLDCCSYGRLPSSVHC